LKVIGAVEDILDAEVEVWNLRELTRELIDISWLLPGTGET